MYIALFVFFNVFLLITMAEIESRSEAGIPRFEYDCKIIERLVHLEDNDKVLERGQSTVEQKIAELTKIVQDQREDIEKLQGKVADVPKENKSVFAEVQLIGTNAYAAGQKLVFNNVIANAGHFYNTEHGYFEAPKDGTYLFTATLCTEGNNWVTFNIVQDSRALSEGHPGDSNWHSCSSSTVVTYMSTGSKVWLKMDRIGGGKLSSSYGKPSFTGVLLNSFPRA